MTSRKTKIRALADHGGTAGEQAAAVAALERIGANVPALTPPPRPPLSDLVARRLPVPAKNNVIYRDSALVGFGLRVTAGGVRSWVFDYRVRAAGRRRVFTIGQYPSWSTGAARNEARALRRRVDAGGDPLGDIETNRAAATVAELADRFTTEHLPRKRAGTSVAYKHAIDLHIRPALGAKKVAAVRFADVDAMHRNVTAKAGPYSANFATRVLSKMFSLAIRWELCTTNPVRGIERNQEVKRKRYLDAGELTRLVEALAAHPDKQAANVIRMLLFTGARKGEVFGAKWEDINLDSGVWTKLGATTKQRTDHIVPLSAPALQLLKELRANSPDSEFVFPGTGETGHVTDVIKFWTTICRRADITGLRIHDLRHSFASMLASGGASLPLIGALLGHTQASTTARYAHLFQDPQRAAADVVGAAIVAAGKPRGGRNGR